MPQICDRLNAVKQKSGLTLTAWADRSGVPVSTISRILSGCTENPGLQTVVDLVAAAEVPLSDVLPDLLPPPEAAPAVQPSDALLAEKDARIAALERLARYRSHICYALGLICLALVAVLAFLLAFDLCNPHVGWFRS
ncbi:MAG: helix-turn-helix domain-containing protein [Acutalibacteraceae bacterium]